MLRHFTVLDDRFVWQNRRNMGGRRDEKRRQKARDRKAKKRRAHSIRKDANTAAPPSSAEIPRMQPALDSTADEHMVAYLTYSEIKGRPFRPNVLQELLQRFSWSKTLLRLAGIGASLSNDVGVESYARAVDDGFRRVKVVPEGDMKVAVAYAAAHADRPIVHEQAVYFLEAMALLYGGDESAQDPSDLNVGTMFLLANDYLNDWKQQDDKGLSDVTQVMASLCHVARFNKQPDALREIVRAQLVFSQSVETGKLANPVLRSKIEKLAFYGNDFETYFRSFVLPLLFVASQWGRRTNMGHVEGPVVDPAKWMSSTAQSGILAQSAFAAMTKSRDAAKNILLKNLRPDGLPHSPSLFVSSPFVSAPDGLIVASSPWMVREHLRGGLWMRMKGAVDEEVGDQEEWPRAFGQMFELACRYIAKEAYKSAQVAGKLLVSDAIGDANELEDVVVLEGESAILFSAKSRLVRQAVARDAVSRKALVEWYDEFLFAPRKGSRRAGALHLLDAKIKAIRMGKFPEVSSSVKIFPVLVTFDDLCENGALNRWIDGRCKDLGILQGPDTALALVTPLEGFESLFSLAALGQSLSALLAEKASDNGRQLPLTNFLARYSPQGVELRLPGLEERFNKLSADVKQLLFPEDASKPS
jgi:hypothetical protein